MKKIRAVFWLEDSMICNVCYNATEPNVGIKLNRDRNTLKLYMADTGLLIAMLDEETQEDLRVNKNLGIYKGALYESIVGEALYKQGYALYYYKREQA